MSKFNFMSLIFAIAMCLFVGAGSINYRMSNTSLDDVNVPLATNNDQLKILINKDENVTDGYRITDKLEVKSVDGDLEEVTELRITLIDGDGVTRISKTLTRSDKKGKEIVFSDTLDFRNSSEQEGCILMISYSYLRAGVSGTQSGSRTITDISLSPKSQQLNMNDKPIFKFGGITSKTVLERLQTVEVYANHSSTFTVTSVEAHLYQGGVEYAKNTDGGSRYTDTSSARRYDGYNGYKTSLTVPGNLTPGSKVTIKVICKCVPSSGGSTYTFEDQVTCDYVGTTSDNPSVNPYSNIKFLVNGSENPGTLSVNANFTASVQTSLNVYQIRVDLLDSNGNRYYTGSEYASSLSISDLKMYTKNLSSLSNHKAEITLTDNNKNQYTHKVPFSLKDDSAAPSGQKGTFKITPSTAKEIKLDETVSGTYTKGNGEIIDSIKLELIDVSSGRTLLSNTNSGGGANISKLDVAFAISRDVTSSNAKIVCTANTRDGNGNTYKWTETITGFQVNLDGEPGKITVTALTPDKSVVKPGDSLRFAGHTDSASKLTSVDIEVYKGNNLFIKESKNMNTSNFEYIYKMPDNEYGDFTFYVTFSGTSKGLSMDPVTESYHYEVWDGNVKVTINSNIYEGTTYSISDITDDSFDPTAWLEYVGNSSIKKFTYELKKSNNILKADTIKAGLFTSCEEKLTGVKNYLKQLYDVDGDFVLTLIAIDTDNKEYKKDVRFSISAGDALVTFDFNPSSSSVAEGSEISFTATSLNEYLKSIEYKLLNDDNEICYQSSITPSANSKTASGKVKVDFGTKRWTSKMFLSVKATDVKGNTTSYSVAYTVLSSKTAISQTIIAKNKTTFKTGSKIDYKSGCDKVKVVLQNKKTNKTIETKTTKDGTLSLPSDEGTYLVKITKTDSENNQIDEEYTYFAVSGDYLVDPNLKESLSVDLWLKEEDRFYEKDKTIPLKIYYMNSGSSNSNLKLSLELPDGITISKCSDGTFKDGKLSLGTVPNDYMGVVNLELSTKNLKEIDKDFEIKASILDGSTEKDSSSQVLFVYKEGEESSSKGYLTGYPDGTIKPDNPITRGEVAAMFSRAFNLEEKGQTKTFKDLKTTQWAYKYIQSCAQNGIIEGYTDGTFKQGNNITVNELATMIYRVCGISNSDPLIVTKKYEEKSTWEKNYIVGLERLNMLESLNTKDSSKNATRGDVVHLINEALFLNPDSSFTSSFKDLPNNHVYKNDIAIASGDYELVRTSDGKVKAK